jgi:hypothetical protein
VIKSSTTTSIPPNLVSDLNNNSITTIFITCGILTVALLVFIAYICNRYNEVCPHFVANLFSGY